MLEMILFPLSITLAVEVPIYLLLKWRDLKLFITASVANLILNPLMNSLLLLIFADKGKVPFYSFLISYEILTTIVEALIIYLVCKIPFKKTILFALLANLSSYLVGLLMNNLCDRVALRIVLTILFLSIFAFIEIITIIHYVKTNKKENAN